jgi:hypothetical protein
MAITQQDINRGDLTDTQWEKLQPGASHFCRNKALFAETTREIIF